MREGIILFLLVLFSIFYHSEIVWAHDTGKKWIYVNDSSDIIVENPIQNPSKLQWAAHYVDQSFRVGDSIKFSVDSDAIEHNLKIESNRLEVTWSFSDGEDFTGTQFIKNFTDTGNYFFSINIKNKETQEIEINELIMIVIGELPEAPKITVNGSENDGGIYKISRSETIEFSIIEPNIRYSYLWDLADQEISSELKVKKQFSSTKLPAYVILRTINNSTGVFSDSYVRLESDDEPEFEIVMPPVKFDQDLKQTREENIKKFEINPVLPFSAIVLLVIIGTYGVGKLYRNLKV